ncbi:MAG: hypothetical protein ABI262_05430 [Microcoleus sp.]|jgi:hypothetical protein
MSVVQIAAALRQIGYFTFQNGQPIDTQGDRIYPEYEVLVKAFVVHDKLV